jgi:hypothetical protein
MIASARTNHRAVAGRAGRGCHPLRRLFLRNQRRRGRRTQRSGALSCRRSCVRRLVRWSPSVDASLGEVAVQALGDADERAFRPSVAGVQRSASQMTASRLVVASVVIAAGICQMLFVAYFTVTHWVKMPLFNDLRHENKPVIASMQIILGVFAIGTLLRYRWALWCAAVSYAIVMTSHLLEWWIPYLTGWPKWALGRPVQAAARCLPERGDRPVPDYLHTGIGVLVLASLTTSWLALAR